MNWLNSLRDHLPLLLVLSPLIGFLVTFAAAKTERDLIRPFAISNSLCTLLILAGVVWQFELEAADVRATLRLAENENFDANEAAASLELVHDQLDKERAERIRHQFFSVDGINLWPTIVVVVLTGVIVWPSNGVFVPLVFLFESLTVAALTSCDLNGFLLASGTAAIVISAVIGALGGPDRRNLAEQFLFAQLAGGALVMLGFAMLVVSVPWMKIEDSPSFPAISTNLGTLVYESQKWATRNQLAYQYQNETFPWMLLVLSLGFAIQSGMFPFHSWLIAVLSETRREIAVLCLAGTVSAAGIGWYRFVVPLAPDLLVGFDRLILIPAMGGAAWGVLRARVPYQPRRRVAFLFLGLSAISLLGCYCFTTIGMCGGWLMQQQLILVVCAVLLSRDVAGTLDQQNEDDARTNSLRSSSWSAGTLTALPAKPLAAWDEVTRSGDQQSFSAHTLLLLLCLPALGLFAASCMIVSELLRDSLLLITMVFVVGILVIRSLHSMLIRNHLDEPAARSVIQQKQRIRGPLIVIALLAIVVNLFPSWMLHQCEPEFDRVFRRFERLASK